MSPPGTPRGRPDGMPVLAVKPYLEEFGPRGDVHQPEWSRALMRDYF